MSIGPALASALEAMRSASSARVRSAAITCGAAAPHVIAADLTRAEDAERMASSAEASAGPIDILVNSAGAALRYAPADLDATAWHDAMDAKFFSYIHAIDA